MTLWNKRTARYNYAHISTAARIHGSRWTLNLPRGSRDFGHCPFVCRRHPKGCIYTCRQNDTCDIIIILIFFLFVHFIWAHYMPFKARFRIPKDLSGLSSSPPIKSPWCKLKFILQGKRKHFSQISKLVLAINLLNWVLHASNHSCPQFGPLPRIVVELLHPPVTCQWGIEEERVGVFMVALPKCPFWTATWSWWGV